MGLSNCTLPMVEFIGTRRTNLATELPIGSSTSLSITNTFPRPGILLPVSSPPWNAVPPSKPTTLNNPHNLNLAEKSPSTSSNTKISTEKAPFPTTSTSQGQISILKIIGMNSSKTSKKPLKATVFKPMDWLQVTIKLENTSASEIKPSFKEKTDSSFTRPTNSDGILLINNCL